MGMSWKPILISLLCLGPGLVACGTGYHFSGVQAIADPSGVVHIVATVDMETEGGGGVYRAEVVSLYPDGVERSSLKLYRVADQALFVDATGALLLIRQHWPDPPLARLEGKRWRPFTLSDDLSEEATEWLDDIVVQGVGWTDEAGATRVYLPGEGLSGWIFDLAEVTVSWPEGDVSVPIDVSTGERLQVQLVAGAGGGS